MFLLISKPNRPPDSKPRPQAGRSPEAMGGKPTKLYMTGRIKTSDVTMSDIIEANKTQRDATLLAMIADSAVQSSIYTTFFS